MHFFLIRPGVFNKATQTKIWKKSVRYVYRCVINAVYGRTTEGRRANFDFMNSSVKRS